VVQASAGGVNERGKGTASRGESITRNGQLSGAEKAQSFALLVWDGNFSRCSARNRLRMRHLGQSASLRMVFEMRFICRGGNTCFSAQYAWRF